jgi:hypothetical protein
MILKIDHHIHDVDLTHLLSYASEDVRDYLILGAGLEQYKLLAHLSSQLPSGSLVGDLGTLFGNSAIALASNPFVQVLTCDPVDHFYGATVKYKTLVNVVYEQCPAIELIPKLLDAKLILVDIGNHEGILEAEVVNYLLDHDYKGILVFDDIHFNKEMQLFWDEILLDTVGMKKYDVTKIGHWSGSGILIFSPNDIDVEVNI